MLSLAPSVSPKFLPMIVACQEVTRLTEKLCVFRVNGSQHFVWKFMKS